MNNGVTVVPDGQSGNRSVAAAVADFLDETKLTKKPKTLAAYTTALNYFTESCPKLYSKTLTAETCSSLQRFSVTKRSRRPGLSTTNSKT